MRRFLKYFMVVFVIVFAWTIIFPILRDKQENTHDVNLNLPMGTRDSVLVTRYTKECTETRLSDAEFPKHILGISTVPPLGKEYYRLAKELNVTWMRAEFDWRAIENPDGSYDWSSADTLVAEMNTFGFYVLGTINYLPVHLKTWEDIRIHFQRFVRALAERYHSKGIRFYEVFNEPNLTGWGWIDKEANPNDYIGEYAILLALANKEIHAVDSSAVVVLGGVSSDDVIGMSYRDFLIALVDYGSLPCFDILAFHPYGHEGKFDKTVTEISSYVEQNGVRHKPIWFDEYGADEDSRLEYTIQSMFMERDVVDAWFWFTLRDLRPNKRWTYGLTDYEFQKKDAFEIFSKYAQREILIGQ